MAHPHPNAQLEAALVQFGQQSGVTADQEAQLRSAITSDARLLGQLNQAARAGQLQGFSLPAAGSSSPNLVGQYDLQSGVVTLPPSAFQPNGTAASADLKAVMQVQEMTIRFGHSTYLDPPQAGVATQASHPVSQDMLDNLQSTINGSPVLADEVKRAATTPNPATHPTRMLLENFAFVRPDVHAGGTYDGYAQTMNLPALGLQSNTPSNPQGRFNPDDLTFVIGHEIQHGFDHPGKSQATTLFGQQIGQIAQSAAVVHDYTAPIRDYIQAGRDDEAKAEIAGWNALLSRHQQTSPNFSLDDMRQRTLASGRTADFVELDAATNTTIARTGLTFNADNTLSQTPANIAAMGQHYFNRPDPAHAQPGQRPVNLGESGLTDYTNYYGTGAIENIIQVERQHAQHHPGVTHQLTIDMAAIGLREDLMEQEGINIRINKATPQPYRDSSQSPPAQRHFDHTQDGSVNPQHDHQYVPVVPGGATRGNGHVEGGERAQTDEAARTPPAVLNALNPADRQLHQRMLEVARTHGFDDERAGNIAAQGVLAFKRDGLVRQADDVGIYGGNLMTSYFPFGRDREPNYHTPPLDAASAAQVPAQQTLQQAAEVERQQAQQQTLAPQVQQSDGPKGPSMGARAL